MEHLVDLYKRDPRSFAEELVSEGFIDWEMLAQCLLRRMSHDDVRDALDVNELSPRFAEGFDNDDEEQEND
jgi:hypothetical protein